MSAISIVRGDITKLKVNAIVNAANEKMLGGSGVDGAIHKAAGPMLRDECSKLPIVKTEYVNDCDDLGDIIQRAVLHRCLPGDVIRTGAHWIPCDSIFHTVGPRYHAYEPLEAHELLRQCYFKSLEEATNRDYKSIAFPCISTGVFGFPLSKACEIAMDTCLAYDNPDLRVTFCIFDDANFQEYFIRYHHMKTIQVSMSRSRITKDTV